MRLGPIEINKEALEQICHKWQVVRLEVFGSVLRGDFNAESDVDLLVDFAPEATVTFFDLYAVEQEFSALLGRTVDVVSRRGLNQSGNWIRRQEILNSAVTLYAA